MEIESEYAQNEWIEQNLQIYHDTNGEEAGSTEIISAVQSRRICLADRYFNTRYFPDPCGNDICIMQHSNRICIVGLAAGHAVFRKCTNDETHNIVGVDFQLNSSFNLLQCKVSGRKKRGCHKLQQGNSNHCLGYAVCDRGERHALMNGCNLPGRLYESNSRLSLNVPKSDRVPLASIGHAGNNSAYLAVIMPPRIIHDSLESGNGDLMLSAGGLLTGGLTWDEYKSLRGL